MYNEQAFRVLKIEPTDNKKEIKKAYSALVKQYHPEEHPREWEMIRTAYETAISYADGDRVDETVSMQSWESNLVFDTAKSNTDEEKIFDDLEEIVAEQRKQMSSLEKEQLNVALERLNELATVKKVKKWEAFFSEQDIRVLCQDEFLNQWSEIILKLQPNKALRRLFKRQLNDIVQYSFQNDIKHKRDGLVKPTERIQLRLNADTRQVRKEKALKYLKIICTCIWILTVFLVKCGGLHEEKKPEIEFKPLHLTHYVDSVVYEFQETLNAEYIVYGRYSEKIEEMLNNAAEIEEGIRLIKPDSAIRQNTMCYECSDLSETEDIETIIGNDKENRKYYAVQLWTTDSSHVAALCFIPEQLGIESTFKVYYSYGDKYYEVERDISYISGVNDVFLYQFGDYFVFSLKVADKAEEGVKIVIVNEVNDVE